MEGWFALAEQFHTQAEPAFCGLGSLVVALNALQIDPGRAWKGPWRWYGEELLDCCQPLEKVQETGVTLDELACLARCNGAAADVVRADAADASALRENIKRAASAHSGQVLLAAYSRRALGQTGSGHFSPVGGYHPGRDVALVLDVARFKYPPHWVPVEDLWRAMVPHDPATGRARGWLLLARAAHASLPSLYRVTAPRGLTALAATMLERLPALLRQALESPDWLTPWIAAVNRELGDDLAVMFERRDTTHSADAADVTATVLAELRTSPAHAAVRAATPGSSAASQDLMAMLLLALPDSALAAGTERASVISLRRPDALGPALAHEVAALRRQLAALGSARACC